MNNKTPLTDSLSNGLTRPNYLTVYTKNIRKIDAHTPSDTVLCPLLSGGGYEAVSSF